MWRSVFLIMHELQEAFTINSLCLLNGVLWGSLQIEPLAHNNCRYFACFNRIYLQSIINNECTNITKMYCLLLNTPEKSLDQEPPVHSTRAWYIIQLSLFTGGVYISGLLDNLQTKMKTWLYIFYVQTSCKLNNWNGLDSWLLVHSVSWIGSSCLTSTCCQQY